MLRWIRNKRVIRFEVTVASAALSLAIATGVVAYIATDSEAGSRAIARAIETGSPAVPPRFDMSLAAFIEPPPVSAADPSELLAMDVAATLRDDEARAREATEAARLEAEERTRAEEAALAASQAAAEEAARARATEAEAARLAATRAATATTPATAAATPMRTATAVVTSALTADTTSIQGAAAAAGWPAELLPKVERVVMCESSGRTTAVSPAGYVGLMQVAPWLHGTVPADAVGQLAQAYDVYLRQGWGAWPVCGR
ncbi:MAG: transglycosylase family protein [Dehalococcoidia bacterium]